MRAVGGSSQGAGNKQVSKDFVNAAFYPGSRATLSEDAVLVRDGASARTAKDVAASPGTCDLKILAPGPANSPDLTAMDHAIFGPLRRAAQKQNPQSEINLEEGIRRAALDLDVGAFRKFVDQFPKRLTMCVERDGDYFQ